MGFVLILSSNNYQKMSNDYKSPAFKKLLDSLQQQSWELELIISGFAIFGLFTAYSPIKIAVIQAENDEQIYAFVIYVILLIACSILLFNLLLHVVLRGLWIGALGLRYVSGDIEFDKLKYSDRFKNYLSKKIVSFDRYIARLEDYCSVLFAISFLLIFYVIGFTLVIVCLALTANYILDSKTLPNWVSKGIGIPLILFLVFGMLLTFIDFLFQGILKKNRVISTLYFPIYWVFSFITLSFLYRPLLYNFLDHKFGKRLLLVLTPVYAVILFLTSFNYNKSNYLDPEQNASAIFDAGFGGNNVQYIKNAAIPSKVINSSFLKILIPFDDNIEDQLFNYNEGLKPEKDRRGLRSEITVTGNWKKNLIAGKRRDSLRKVYMDMFNETHYFLIDTLKLDADFIISNNNKDHIYFETYLGIGTLDDGKHILRIKRKRKRNGKMEEVTDALIPFWYFKDD